MGEESEESQRTIERLFMRGDDTSSEGVSLEELIGRTRVDRGIQTDFGEEIRLRSASPGTILRSIRGSRPSAERIIEMVRLCASKGDIDGLSEADGTLFPYTVAHLLSYAEGILESDPVPARFDPPQRLPRPGLPLIMQNKLFMSAVVVKTAQQTTDNTLVTGSGGYFRKGREGEGFRGIGTRRIVKGGRTHTRSPGKSPFHCSPPKPQSPHTPHAKRNLASAIRSVPISPRAHIVSSPSPKHVTVDLAIVNRQRKENESKGQVDEIEKPGLAPKPYPKTSIDFSPAGSPSLNPETTEKGSQIYDLNFEARYRRARDAQKCKDGDTNTQRYRSANSFSSPHSPSSSRLYTKHLSP